MNLFKKIKEIFFVATFTFPLVSQGFEIRNPIKFDNIPDVLSAVLKYVMVPVATVLVTIMIVFYGMKLVMSQGNPTEVADAKRMIFWALIGGFVILGASAITDVITNTTKGLGA